MKRLIEQQLKAWKNKKDKMPLLIYGARQVGKTTTIFEFGKSYYPNIIVLNFESNPALHSIFEGELNPEKIINKLEALTGQSIIKGHTLLFFDEVQTCPAALTSLKYFCEQAPEYHIIAAGSLLGVSLYQGQGEQNKLSFPVGKVELLTMYPMTFEEFLAQANPFLLNAIKNAFASNTPLTNALHIKALELYRNYLFVGGMPRAVAAFLLKGDTEYVRLYQNEILSLYAADMAKYTSRSEQVKIMAIYNSIPYQLAKENKKFQYSIIGSNARASSYEVGLHWLTSAGLVIKCKKAREGKLPLAFYEDRLSYKIYMSDIGLLNAKSNIPCSSITAQISIGGEAKGAMTESYIAQELLANGHQLYYWESKGKAEIDFVIQLNDNVIPIEVKAADNIQAKSLKQFVNKYAPAYSIRISSKNFGFENNIKAVPLYAVFCI